MGGEVGGWLLNGSVSGKRRREQGVDRAFSSIDFNNTVNFNMLSISLSLHQVTVYTSISTSAYITSRKPIPSTQAA